MTKTTKKVATAATVLVSARHIIFLISTVVLSLLLLLSSGSQSSTSTTTTTVECFVLSSSTAGSAVRRQRGYHDVRSSPTMTSVSMMVTVNDIGLSTSRSWSGRTLGFLSSSSPPPQSSSGTPFPSSLSSQRQRRSFLLFMNIIDDDDEDPEVSNKNKDANTQSLVKVGTKEYLDGFLSSPIRQREDGVTSSPSSSSDRGDGLEQAIKLAGGVSLFLVVLVVGFMASNGLLQF